MTMSLEYITGCAKNIYKRYVFKFSKKCDVNLLVDISSNHVSEIVDWCSLNIGQRRQKWECIFNVIDCDGNNTVSQFPNYSVNFQFLDESDASIFALRWG